MAEKIMGIFASPTFRYIHLFRSLLSSQMSLTCSLTLLCLQTAIPGELAVFWIPQATLGSRCTSVAVNGVYGDLTFQVLHMAYM